MIKYLYFALSLLLYVGAIPYLIYLSFKKKYKDSIPSRFFLRNNPSFTSGGHWFHACSLGEVKSLKPILDHFEDSKISVITNTGYKEACELSHEVRFLPFEIFLPFWIRNHKSLIVVEAEIWYFLFLFAKQNEIKTILINARISDRSYPRYRKFAWFYKEIFKHIDVVLAQSEVDAKRLKSLGAKEVKVFGNIKTLSNPKVSTKLPKPKKTMIVIASSHESEEEIILDAFSSFDDLCVVIVPRHPERFALVDRLLQKYAFAKSIEYHRYSKKQNFEADLVLIDAMGELNNIYAICDVVILAGSFIKSAGGHNPLEPAYFKKPIISGPKYFNQKELYKVVENIYIAQDSKKLQELVMNHKDLKPSYITNICDIKELIKEIQ